MWSPGLLLTVPRVVSVMHSASPVTERASDTDSEAWWAGAFPSVTQHQPFSIFRNFGYSVICLQAFYSQCIAVVRAIHRAHRTEDSHRQKSTIFSAEMSCLQTKHNFVWKLPEYALEIKCKFQSCGLWAGSRFGRIRIHSNCWIRFRIRNTESDPI